MDYPYKTILESAGFTVSDPHDPIHQHIYLGVYGRQKIHSKLSHYTITLDGESYDNMIVSDTTDERALLRQFFRLFTRERKEKEKYKKLYEQQNQECVRMREHATRILYPTPLDEPEIL